MLNGCTCDDCWLSDDERPEPKPDDTDDDEADAEGDDDADTDDDDDDEGDDGEDEDDDDEEDEEDDTDIDGELPCCKIESCESLLDCFTIASIEDIVSSAIIAQQSAALFVGMCISGNCLFIWLYVLV